jgi:4-hydroxy-tetrahydrodipicolinate synthase
VFETIGGVFPVLPTPFDGQGAVDVPGLERVLDYVIGCGVDGVVFPGLASEYDYLTLDERQTLVAAIGRRTARHCAFIVGASAQSLEESAALARAGAKAGAVGAMVVTPARLGHDLEALAGFYRDLGREGGLPLMLQNAPAPMGLGLSTGEVLTILSRTDAIAWVKEENMPCGQRITALLAAAPPTLKGVFGGAGGRYITDELARGAVGTMPASELTEMHVGLMAAHRSKDETEVRVLYEAMLPVLMMQAVFRWRLTKAVLKRRGVIGSDLTRAEGAAMDACDHQELDRMLDRLKPHLSDFSTLHRDRLHG